METTRRKPDDGALIALDAIDTTAPLRPDPAATTHSDGRRGDVRSHGRRHTVHGTTGRRRSEALSGWELATRLRTTVPGTVEAGGRLVAVVGVKGGVGATTTTLSLGHMFAARLGERVLAVDASPSAVGLVDRIRRQTDATAFDVLAAVDDIDGYTDVRRFVSLTPSRLEVLANTTGRGDAVGEQGRRRLLEVLARHYPLLVADAAIDPADTGFGAVVEAADVLVVVVGAAIDAAGAADRLLDQLEDAGHGSAVAGAVAVINGCRSVTRRRMGVDRIEQRLADRCRAVVRVPLDRHLVAGGTVDLRACARATRRGYWELAGQVADALTAEPETEER